MYENAVAHFLGVKQDDNPLTVKPGESLHCYARICDNLRPLGGLLEKVKGRDRHSTLLYELASRPVTLIPYARQYSATTFMCTAWDAILKWSGTVWESIHTAADTSTDTPGNNLQNPDNTDDCAECNRPFDYLIYNDILYLTDGYNYPMKYDATNSKLGTWGYKPLTCGTLPLTFKEDAVAGNIQDWTMRYKATLYNSITSEESNISTNYLEVNPTAINKKFNIYVNTNGSWDENDAYDIRNDFANKIRIYRAKGNVTAHAADDDHYYLAATVNNVPFPDGTGLLEDAGVTGTLTITVGHFLLAGHEVEVGYVVKDNTSGGAYLITGVTDLVLNLVNIDNSGAFTPAGAACPKTISYMILPGFTDNTINREIAANLYFGDDDSLDSNEKDHGFPERCMYCALFKDRAFIAGDHNYPNRVYYSEIGFMDYFPAENYVDIDADDGDVITGLFVFQGRLYVFKKNSTAILNAFDDPFQWTVTPKYLSVGAIDIRSVADCDGVLALVNTSGVYLWDGSSLSHISHKEDGSNFIESWRDVKLNRLEDTRVVYHEARNELWVALTLDDERNLYSSTKAGLGYMGSVIKGVQIANDAAVPPQNTGTWVYRLDNGQWLFIPHQYATAFCVFKGYQDSLQLYSGAEGGVIYREDYTECLDTIAGYIGTVTSGNTLGLIDSAAAWTTNQWAGADVYVCHISGSAGEHVTVLSNTATALIFTLANPLDETVVAGDFYMITDVMSSEQTIDVHWQTPMLVFNSFKDLKWFLEMVVRVYGSGTITISYILDGGERTGGSFSFSITGAATLWDQNVWDDYEEASTPANALYWTEIEDMIRELNFPENEGRFIELDITTDNTCVGFNISMMVLGYKLHRGNRWLP
jgi:hypothetical protein